MSDVLHRDGVIRALAKGASTASALFNAIDSGSLPELMRDLRALVEMREIEVNRVGTTFFYYLPGASAPSAEAVAQTAFNERPPSKPVPQIAERRKARVVSKPEKPASAVSESTPRKRKSRPDSDAAKLLAAIGSHPWERARRLVELSGITDRNTTKARDLVSSALTYLLRIQKVQRTGSMNRYRYALSDCTVPPPPAPVALAPRPRRPIKAHHRNAVPRTSPSLRGTLDGMLVELNALGQVRLISSGHARLQWMCSLCSANGLMVSSNWRNDAREAVIDLRDRLAQLRSQQITELDSTPEAAQAQAA